MVVARKQFPSVSDPGVQRVDLAREGTPEDIACYAGALGQPPDGQ